MTAPQLINVILGFSQVLGRDSKLNHMQTEMLAAIQRNGEHLLNLINDILDMAKIESGRVGLQTKLFERMGKHC